MFSDRVYTMYTYLKLFFLCDNKMLASGLIVAMRLNHHKFNLKAQMKI